MNDGNIVSRLFRRIGRVLTGLVKAFQVLVFLLFIVVILSALMNLSGGAIEIPESAALVLAPSGRLVEQPVPSWRCRKAARRLLSAT